jgi:hypothetical protein
MEELKDLKAQAYDCIAAIEYYQKLLAEINSKIEQLNKQTNGNVQ